MRKIAKKSKTVEEQGFKRLTPFEKETIIVFNKGEKEASIFTYEKTWQQHLEKCFKVSPEFVNKYGGKSYIIDKDRIMKPRVRYSRKKKVIKSKEKSNS